MRRKVTSNIIQCLILLLPLATFAVEPTSIVFTRYQENYIIHKDNKAEITLTLSTEKSIAEPFLFPLAINNNQDAEVHTSNKNIQVSLITIDNQVYLEINPDPTIISGNKTLTINLTINDFITGDGFIFRKKSASIPLISNYPNNSKNNIFIDAYSSVITIPENYKLEKNEIGKSDSDYKIFLDENELSDHVREVKISAQYLNLHSIKHELVQLSRAFNPIILMVLIFGLLALYLIYFSSLIKYEEPVQKATTRY